MYFLVCLTEFGYLFRLYKLYRYTHDRMHSRVRALKVHYYVSSSETILGWVSFFFQIHIHFILSILLQMLKGFLY